MDSDTEKQRAIDYKECFAAEAGKRVLADLIRNHPTVRQTAATLPGGLNTNAVMYGEGQRSVILYIQKMLAKDPYQERQTKAKGN